MDIYIWGTGNIARKLKMWMEKHVKDVHILAFTDSFAEEEAEFLGERLFPKEKLSVECDYVVMAVHSPIIADEIIAYMTAKYAIEQEKIISYTDFMNLFRKEKIIEKYKSTVDPDICSILSWLKKGHALTVRNCFENDKETIYPVQMDEKNGFPYAMVFGKKMYFPKDYHFLRDEQGNRYIKNIYECDQYEGSPHLYTTKNHKPKAGDIIVDAGVAEGNFALRYIDEAERIYLIESEPRWLEVLHLTFAPYESKVVFIDKPLGKRNTETEITLDAVLSENACDFIKMDIEGAEPDALLGGVHILANNNPILSVCAYHNREDEKYIKFILNALGYETCCSTGYMFFAYDENIDMHLDFRRGIVYGKKRK